VNNRRFILLCSWIVNTVNIALFHEHVPLHTETITKTKTKIMSELNKNYIAIRDTATVSVISQVVYRAANHAIAIHNHVLSGFI